MNQHFLNGVSKYQQKILKKTVDLGLDFINGKARNNKVINYKTPLEIKLLMDQPIPLSSQKYSESIKILETIGKYSISQSDLNYIAFPDSGNSLAGMMGEIYSKFLNQNLVAYDRSAPIATIIEIQLIEWLRQLIGYDYKKISEINNLSEVSGMWTTGGHMSNHIAILTALNHKYPTLKTSGLPSLSITPKIVVAGNISHYSIASAAHHLGLGNDCLINCLSNPDFTTNCDDLIQILESRQKQNDVFLVIGVAGNTRTSSIDNLKKIAQICSRFGVWFHVDACHGGSLLFSPKLKRLFLDGIELADSVSLDPHKGMFITYPSSYVIFKKRDALVKFTRYENQVRDGTAWDLGYITPFFGSRGFESLKLWLMIKSQGTKRLGQVVGQRYYNALYAARLVEKSGMFSIFHQMSFYRMVFVFYPNSVRHIAKGVTDSEMRKELKKCIDSYTHKINQLLYEEGKICLDEFKLHDLGDSTGLNSGEDRFLVMSITIGNPLYTHKSLARTLGHLFAVAKKYTKPMESDVLKITRQRSHYVGEQAKVYGPAGWN